MKKRRLFILIYAMLICLALVGCGESKDDSSSSEDSEDAKVPHTINASVIAKYSEKEIVIYSDTSCFFDLEVSVSDEESESEITFKKIQISEGKTITLTLEDLAPGFFSDRAIITKVTEISSPYVYTEISLNDVATKNIDCQILMKYTSEEITIYSDESCFFDLFVITEGNNFNSCNIYRRVEIKEGTTITLTLEDLAPGFFSDNTYIEFVSSYIYSYVYVKEQ